MKKRGLKQTDAVALFGVRQPDVSKMLRAAARGSRDRETAQGLLMLALPALDRTPARRHHHPPTRDRPSDSQPKHGQLGRDSQDAPASPVEATTHRKCRNEDRIEHQAHYNLPEKVREVPVPRDSFVHAQRDKEQVVSNVCPPRDYQCSSWCSWGPDRLDRTHVTRHSPNAASPVQRSVGRLPANESLKMQHPCTMGGRTQTVPLQSIEVPIAVKTSKVLSHAGSSP